ncbi:MAG: hypothetical protein IPK82_11460 [Polyangiaceae bacterium]|nr:hypothetical protein [Polyangiaceae bacterium]
MSPLRLGGCHFVHCSLTGLPISTSWFWKAAWATHPTAFRRHIEPPLFISAPHEQVPKPSG